ncbi:Reticulon family protein [Euphorbia peplus]|nr:Reticulon family protein [Euphorbia peplus]
MGETPPRSISVHRVLGAGSVADVLLWKRWGSSLTLLLSATTLWLLFERGGYNLLSFVANVLFLLVAILFLWAKSACLLNRPLPPVPDLEISEETIAVVAGFVQLYGDRALAIGRDIAIGRNLILFLQVALVLWVVSFVGSLCNFLTFVYIGVLLSLSVPVLYDKYQHHIDEKLSVTHKVIQTQYRKIDDSFLKKLPLPSNKEKKIE